MLLLYLLLLVIQDALVLLHGLVLLPVLLLNELLKLHDFLLAREQSAVSPLSILCLGLVELPVFRLSIRAHKVVRQLCRLPFDVLDGVGMFEGIGRDLFATLLADVALQLLDARLLALDARFRLQRDPVICVELFLELDDGLVSLIEA